MAANVVSLSFKNNPDEIDLYNYLKSKSSPSAYVKELIKQDISDKHMSTENTKTRNLTDTTNKDINEEKKEQVVINKISNMSSLYK